ncbi:MAG: PorT family protein [Deltaproteobacteria bacterium]|nr:PorT family protein [Deltaproteobacteria bacterium]
MKKIYLLLTVVLISANVSFGQFALGVKIGYNANKLSTNIDTIKTQFNSGFHVGIWTHLGKRFYVAPEVLYTMSGAIFDNQGQPSTKDWKQKITIGTLDIPILLGFKIIHSDVITWRFELGPEASFVVNQKIKELNSPIGPITEADINKINWYIEAGTGIDVLFLAFNIRYKYGLNKMIKDVQNNWTFDSHNGMFLVSVGFKIFGKK